MPLKQSECLTYVSTIEEAMVGAFPFKGPAEFDNLPQLLGRAEVQIDVKRAPPLPSPPARRPPRNPPLMVPMPGV